MKAVNLGIICVLLTVWGCKLDDGDQQGLSIFSQHFDFNEGLHDWTPGFAEYPVNAADSSAFELRSEYAEPIESKLSKRSLMLSGNNVNRDLFMYIKRKVGGLRPNTDYTITFKVELTSDLQAVKSTGDGSVFLKAGAVHSEPKSVIEGGRYIMNIDKGDQENSGEDMITLGDLFEDGTGTAYSLITRSNTMANSRYVARTNSNGELWLIIGADSSVEGTTKIFFTRIKVLLSVS